MGPVKFTEVFAERIGLAWNPPKDDGGSKITNYVVEKREENRKSWVHVSNDPKECAYVVTRLTENHEYEFRVMAQNKFGVGPPLVSEPEKARNLFSKFRSITCILPMANVLIIDDCPVPLKLSLVSVRNRR